MGDPAIGSSGDLGKRADAESPFSEVAITIDMGTFKSCAVVPQRGMDSCVCRSACSSRS